MAPSKGPTEEASASTKPTYEYLGGAAPPSAAQTTVAPAVKEKTVKDAVVHETVKSVVREVVRPVVEREKVRTEIKQVVQPILDVVTEAPVVNKRTLEEQTHRYREKTKQSDLERYQNQSEAFHDDTHEAEEVHEKIYKQPIIREVVKSKIITEVQPIIERVIKKTHILEETLPIKETFVKAPIVHEQHIADPITMEEFAKLYKSPKKGRPSETLSPSPVEPDHGPMTRLKRKSMVKNTKPDSLDAQESADNKSSGLAALHGAVEKIVGAVEAGIGELLGSGKLVAKGEARKEKGEEEIEHAQAAKKRKVG